MKILRTPDDSFENLTGYPFKPNYIKIWDSEDQELRIHYIDEGPLDAKPVLLMHGEPSWSYLYRKMIPIITDAGYRAIAPDLVDLVARTNQRTGRITPINVMLVGCRHG